jgi:hypothetical protein
LFEKNKKSESMSSLYECQTKIQKSKQKNPENPDKIFSKKNHPIKKIIPEIQTKKFFFVFGLNFRINGFSGFLFRFTKLQWWTFNVFLTI